MFHLDHFTGYSPLYLAQAAFTIWMLLDANRRGVDQIWFWLILFFQPLGCWAYFVMYKLSDFTRGGATNWLSNLFTRRASLEELRYRVEQSPTSTTHKALANRLIELKQYDEAEPHLNAVLAREPDLGTALFALAECHRQRGRPAEAIPLLLKVTSQQSNWGNYQAWHTLIETYQKAGDHTEAVAQARKLAQVVPSLEHTCLLARCLGESGDQAEARRVLEKGLDAYRFNRNPSRNDRRWVGKTKRLLKKLG